MFSLSHHQKKYFLNEDVGEIYIYYKDIEILFELIENYPNKQILIILPKDDTEQIDYLFISACASRARVECECNTFIQIIGEIPLIWIKAFNAFPNGCPSDIFQFIFAESRILSYAVINCGIKIVKKI